MLFSFRHYSVAKDATLRGKWESGEARLQGGLDTVHALAAAKVPEEGVLDRVVHHRGGNAPRSCQQRVGVLHQRLDCARLEHCQRLQQLRRALGLSTKVRV